jgi:hypothetical protein
MWMKKRHPSLFPKLIRFPYFPFGMGVRCFNGKGVLGFGQTRSGINQESIFASWSSLLSLSLSRTIIGHQSGARLFHPSPPAIASGHTHQS